MRRIKMKKRIAKILVCTLLAGLLSPGIARAEEKTQEENTQEAYSAEDGQKEQISDAAVIEGEQEEQMPDVSAPEGELEQTNPEIKESGNGPQPEWGAITKTEVVGNSSDTDFSVGSLSMTAPNLFTRVAGNGIALKRTYENGRFWHTYTRSWEQEGLKPVVIDKKTNSPVTLSETNYGQQFPMGSYELWAVKDDFEIKVTDFNVKTLEELVDESLTLGATVHYEIPGTGLQSMNIVTRFVVAQDGLYVFKINGKVSLQLRDSNANLLDYSNYDGILEKRVWTVDLRAGTYYIESQGTHSYDISVTQENLEIVDLNIIGGLTDIDFAMGDVSKAEENIFSNTLNNDVKVKLVYEDGTKSDAIPAYKWFSKGIKPVIVDKNTNTAVALKEGDYSSLPLGSYELKAVYNDITIKITDFNVKKLEDSVDKILTVASPVHYDVNDRKIVRSVTKFVVDHDGVYVFKTNAKSSLLVADEKGSIRWVLNPDGSEERELTLDLKAGTYYLKVGAYYLFDISVAEKLSAVTGMSVMGSLSDIDFSLSDFLYVNEKRLLSIVGGSEIKIKFVYDDGAEGMAMDAWAWAEKGIKPIVIDKETDTTVTVSSSGYFELPIGSYELNAVYNDITVKITDFNVKSLADLADQTITDSNPVHYDTTAGTEIKTVTKFEAAYEGMYTFKTNVKSSLVFSDEAGESVHYSNSDGSPEREVTVHLLKGTYYLTAVAYNSFGISFVSMKKIASISQIEPEKEYYYNVKSLSSLSDLHVLACDQLKIEINYQGNTSEIITLKQYKDQYCALGLIQSLSRKSAVGSFDMNEAQTGIFLHKAYIRSANQFGEKNLTQGKIYVYKEFKDVDSDAWYYEYINKISAAGLMTGLNDTMFGPSESLKRAQFAVMLYRMCGSPQVNYEQKFIDVQEGLWYTDAILWANSIGVVTGYSSGYFGPADDINREQMAIMLYRLSKNLGYDINGANDMSSFPDQKQVSDFAKEGMAWVVSKKIITGNNSKLDPQGLAVRAQAATIMTRYKESFSPWFE